MKLLFENWRQYLKEEEDRDDREKLKTIEERLLTIFLNSGARQALELGYSLGEEIDQELLAILEEALSTFHDLMKAYRQAGKTPVGLDNPTRLRMKRKKRDHAYELYNKFFTELKKLYLHKPPFIRPPYPHDLRIDSYNSPLIDLATNLRKKISKSWRFFQPLSTEESEYVEAVEWAGEPPE